MPSGSFPALGVPHPPESRQMELIEQWNMGQGVWYGSQADTCLVVHRYSSCWDAGAVLGVPFCHSCPEGGSERLHRTGHIHMPAYTHL